MIAEYIESHRNVTNQQAEKILIEGNQGIIATEENAIAEIDEQIAQLGEKRKLAEILLKIGKKQLEILEGE